jgi:hypothetical protein
VLCHFNDSEVHRLETAMILVRDCRFVNCAKIVAIKKNLTPMPLCCVPVVLRLFEILSEE